MLKNVSKFLIIFIIAAVAFTSCQKEEAVTESKTNDPVLERILDFKKDVENPNYKSGEYIDVEDAVWLVEAALNYSYCVFTEEKIESNVNTFVTNELINEANLTNGQISFYDVINLYLSIEEDMQPMLDEIENDVKFFHIVDVEFEDNSFKTSITLSYFTQHEKSTTDDDVFWEDALWIIEDYVNDNYMWTYPYNGFYSGVGYTSASYHAGWTRINENPWQEWRPDHNGPINASTMWYGERNLGTPGIPYLSYEELAYYKPSAIQSIGLAVDYHNESFNKNDNCIGFDFINRSEYVVNKREYFHKIKIYLGEPHYIIIFD